MADGLKQDDCQPVVIGMDLGGEDMTGVALVARGAAPVVLTIGLDDRSTAGFTQAVAMLAEGLRQLALSDALGDGVADAAQAFVHLGAEGFFEIGKRGRAGGCESVAARTGHATISFDPSERFRELVAAVAAKLNVEIIDVHGWPVLSLVSRTSNVAEAGERDTRVALPGGGEA